MNIEILRDYVIQKSDVTEGFPFGEQTIVFKIKEKIFLLVSLDSDPLQFNVKCDPEKAIELRETYPETVLPGYHMNKKHWNTVIVDGMLSKKQLFEMLDHSYDLVAGGKKAKKVSDLPAMPDVRIIFDMPLNTLEKFNILYFN